MGWLSRLGREYDIANADTMRAHACRAACCVCFPPLLLYGSTRYSSQLVIDRSGLGYHRTYSTYSRSALFCGHTC